MKKPKRLWLKPLQADAKEILCAPVLPQAQLQGGHSAAAGVLPLTQPQCYSLSVPWPCCAPLCSPSTPDSAKITRVCQQFSKICAQMSTFVADS